MLGFHLDSHSQTISLMEEKRDKLVEIFTECMSHTSMKIRTFAKSIGLAVATFLCFPQGKMFHRDLEKSKLNALKIQKFKWGKTMHISQCDRKLLLWWLNTFRRNIPFCYAMRKISYTLETDSSLVGWGCNLVNVSDTGSQFSSKLMHHSINTKEILAVKYSVETYKEILRGKHFVLKCDSVTALLDLHCLGTMKNEFRDKIV